MQSAFPYYEARRPSKPQAERGESMKRCWKDWLRKAGIRALRTVAQTALAAIGTSAVISEINWLMVGSTSLLAGVLSLLTSLAGIPEDCPEESEATKPPKS